MSTLSTLRRKAIHDRYNHSAKGRLRQLRYRATVRGHLLRDLVAATPEQRLKRKLYMQERRCLQ